MFWRIKTTVPFVFYRSRWMKIGTHSSATALLQRGQAGRVLSNYTGMTRTVQLHCPINAQIGLVDNQSDSRILL